MIPTFLTKIIQLWQSFKSMTQQGLIKVLQFVTDLSVKYLGEKKTQAIFDFLEMLRTKYRQFYARYIGYHPGVAKLWKVVTRGALAVFVYWFCIETNFLLLTGEMPSVGELENPKLSVSSELYSADGQLLGKYFLENRTPVKDYRKLSPHLVNALVATEDARFYEHSGIDMQALLGVAVGILKGGDRGGGSTISQQLAKNLFRTRVKSKSLGKTGLLGYIPFLRTVIYKTKEWLTAIKLERRYTKDEIILWYLNTVDYGSNSYGIKVAAQTYFATSPDSLNLQEAAVLVGLQKATTTYNPKLNYEKSLKRRNTVLDQMVKYGYLKSPAADSIKQLPIVLDGTEETPYDGTGNYFKTAVSKSLKAWADTNDIDLDLYRDGLRIYTTIDSRMQTHAENAVSEGMRALQKTFENHWQGKNPWVDENGNEMVGFIDTVAKRTDYYKHLAKKYAKSPDSIQYFMNKPHKIKVFSWKNPEGEEAFTMSAMDSIRYYKKILQAGLMTMDPFTGHIKAWVGGLDYKYFKYDHVKQGRRQPGSTFKPIAYCAAIDGPKNMSPCDQRRDEPFEIEVQVNGQKTVWAPRNADRRFSYSTMSLRRAMARSVNSVAARITDEVGPDTVMYYARKLGIRSPLQAVPSIGLGSFDVSLHEMVAAYCTFLNRGVYNEPLLVTRVEDRNGNLIVEFTNKNWEAIREESAFLMRWMLQGGMQESGGTSQNLWSFPKLFPNYQAEYGGKTGTTSNYSDGWFMGITRDLVTGVWVGGEDRSIHFRTGAYGEGSKTALPIYGRYMTKIFEDKSLGFQPGPFPKPGLKIEKEYKQCSGGSYVPVTSDSLGGGSSSDSLGAPPAPATPAAQADTSGGGGG
jgi:penicillin-binding protein 1A